MGLYFFKKKKIELTVSCFKSVEEISELPVEGNPFLYNVHVYVSVHGLAALISLDFRFSR